MERNMKVSIKNKNNSSFQEGIYSLRSIEFYINPVQAAVNISITDI